MSAPIGKLAEVYSGFDPRTIPGCVAWYDAADTNTVTLSGTNLSKWFDKSSNSNALIPNGDASRTGYSNVINGLKTVSVNGTGGDVSLSNSNAFTLAQPNTSFAVIRTRTTGFAGTFNLLFSFDTALFQYRNQAGSNLSMWAGTADVSQGNGIRFTSNAVRTHVAIFNSNSSFVGANGSMFSTGANPGTNSWINLRVLPTGAVITQAGDCGEVIMYNSSLSSNDRQQIEGYLNWKWGIQQDLLATHPYRSRTQPFTRPLYPLDISGCTLWLDAADPRTVLTVGTGSNVAQWNDKSGNSNNAVQSTAANQPTYSSNGVVFNGALQNLTTSYSASLQNETMFVVATQTAPTTTIGRTIIGSSANGGRQLLTYNTQYAANAQGVASAGIGGTVTQNVRTLFGYRCSSGTSNSVNLLLNGTNVVTGSLVPYTVGLTSMIGKWPGSSTEGWVGPINEIVGYNRPITQAERQRVEGYLAAKWGLRADLSSGSPFKIFPPLYPKFEPIQIPNCALWLDAADVSSIDLSGTGVAAWRDRSGNGVSVIQATASNQPVYSSNDRSLSFNTSNFLNTSYVAPLSNGNTTFVIAFSSSNSGSRENIMIGGTPVINRTIAIGTNQQNTHGNFGVASTSGGWGSLTIGSFSNVISVGVVTVSSGSTVSYVNGGGAGSTVSLTFSNASNVIGGYYNSGTFYNVDSFVGKIYEVIFYNRIITQPERQQVEGYLANKWNLGLVPTTAIPTTYSNCVLWLDAADTSTIDLSGSNVTVWRDKSGNNYNASNSANKGPTYSGGVLNFNGTSNYLSVPTFSMSSSTHCLIAVHKPTTLTGNNQGNTNVFRWQGPYYIVFPYMNGTTPRGYVTSADTSVLDALTSTLVERSITTAYNVITANISNGSQLIYKNGVLMSSNTQPMNTQTQSNFAIGSTVDTLSEFYQGSIAEMIVFNRRLPDSERQAVENHLISKWNTLGLLNEHPYKRAIP